MAEYLSAHVLTCLVPAFFIAGAVAVFVSQGAILKYFGQTLGKDACAACDVCLGHLDTMDDSLETAQKILSCVLRLGERFGGEYTAQVLTGSHEKRILENGHDKLR